MLRSDVVSDLDLQPRWLRVGAASKYGGFSRAKLYLLLTEGQIRSVSLASPGKRRGIRIVDRLSIDEFMTSLGKQQESGK